MIDTLLPIIREMHVADDDRARARVLLTVSDIVFLKHREVFEAACRRASFDLGIAYIDFRRAAMHAVRGDDGLHKNPMFEQVRAALADFAAGGA